MPRVKKTGGDLKTIKRKTKNTLKKVYKVAKVVAPLVPNVVPLVPNKVLLDVVEGKRKDGVYPPAVRRLLSKIGNETVTSIVIVRTPISSFISTFLNVISLGNFNKALRENGYDKALHLSLFINDTYTLDKQAVVSLVKGNPIKKDSETLAISVSTPITFNELLDNTRNLMGDANFSNYNAKTNNCQNFVMSILKANGLLSENESSFIKQDAYKIFQKLGYFTEKIANVVTDTGAIADKVIEGEGITKRKNTHVSTSTDGAAVGRTKWQDYVIKNMKGKKFKSKGESAKFMINLSKAYKKLN